MYVSTKDTHDAEIKVRFTDEDRDLIKLMARRLDMPPAVFVRTIVKQALSAGCASSTSNNALAAQ